MPLIDLPRALEDYFAFAETEPTRRGRRFSITLPYLSGEKLDRLQWWYHVTPAEEQMFDGHALVVFRERAVERFRRHIERWLEINRQRLHDGDPLPRLSPLPARAPAIAGATCATDIPDQGQDEQPESAEELANAS
ncbi:MAG: hypothetical protein DIU71_03100 [Proteobacteria bacterium]|nr:MAG: hypothetical protein DIU71_03100 [Pseudomonadota bacterium]